ncbi:MAG: IS110 family transposase [Alphaproteobacteria bacterium]|nr:IS110 family transposase [Alphaproteobacteria bacterium]
MTKPGNRFPLLPFQTVDRASGTQTREETPCLRTQDISKSALDVHYAPSGTYRRYTSDGAGVAALIESLKPDKPDHIVTEPSGGYERRLLAALQAGDWPVSLVNARQIRDYARSRGILAKTDKLDAAVLSDYGATIRPASSPVLSGEVLRLKALIRRREQVARFIRQEKSAFEHIHEEDLRKMADKHLEYLEGQKEELDGLIEVAMNKADDMKHKAEILRSCKCIGLQTAAILMADMPELGTIDARKAASLAGLAPRNRDSGTWRGQRSISGGRASVTRALYLAAVSASRNNPDIKAYYTKKRNEGKPPKQALIACARKLLLTLNALLRDGRMWTAEYAPADA